MFSTLTWVFIKTHAHCLIHPGLGAGALPAPIPVQGEPGLRTGGLVSQRLGSAWLVPWFSGGTRGAVSPLALSRGARPCPVDPPQAPAQAEEAMGPRRPPATVSAEQALPAGSRDQLHQGPDQVPHLPHRALHPGVGEEHQEVQVGLRDPPQGP